jgi:arsenate reductase-like glutaredoxin family protein
MQTTDTLTLKALLLKQSIEGTGPINDHFLEKAIEANPEQKELRNICAFISTHLFEKVEQTCKNLSLSKRALIEMALIDIIDKADEIMTKHNVFESLDSEEA